MQQGGLILAHNVDMVPDYVKTVTTSEDLETIFYTGGRTLKKLHKAQEIATCLFCNVIVDS